MRLKRWGGPNLIYFFRDIISILNYTPLLCDSTGQRWNATKFSFEGQISRSNRFAAFFFFFLILLHFSQDEYEAAYKSIYNKIKVHIIIKKLMGCINSNTVNLGGSGDKRQPNYVVQRSWKRIKNVALRFLVVRIKKKYDWCYDTCCP